MTPSSAEYPNIAEAVPEPGGDLAEFLESAPVAVHSLDREARIVWANRAELELLGYSAEEYVGQPAASFHVDQAAARGLLEQIVRGETLRDREAWLRAKDGTIRHVLISSRPPRNSNGVRRGARVGDGRNGHDGRDARGQDSERVAARCFTRDITPLRQAEQDRDRLIAELARTVRLNDMFAGIVGHDLRGPLSTIVMAGQLLLGQLDEPRYVRTIERLLGSADRMQRMITQLLDFARARGDGGIELDRRPADLAQIVHDAIEEIRIARPEWRIDLDVRGDGHGDYDGNRLSQVFANLLGNAVEHGSPDGPLLVRIDGSQPAMIQVEIRNRGTIASELLPVLFSPFRGSQHKAAKSQGLGLGLFITEQLVRAHGGDILAESAGGETAFRLALPRHSDGTARVTNLDARPTDAAPARARPSAPASERSFRDTPRGLDERFRILVETIKDYAIFMLDPDGRVATWNAGAQRIKGYTANEIIGRHFSVFYPAEPETAARIEHELRVAQRDGRFEDEDWRVRKDGTRFWANVVITAMRDASGALVGYAKVTRDLTERRQLEEERVRLAHAEEAVRLRDEFLSLASHELRTPLTVLQLQLEALRDRIAVDDRTTLAKLERSNRAGQRLTELVEALLDVSRIATGHFELHLEQTDLSDIVAVAVDRLHETAAVAGCELSFRGVRVVGRWDRSRIDQVVTNLVANSIRYAAGTPIAVSVVREGDDAIIEVRDRGPGLPDGQISRIFERFERGASMRHFGGLGLGLYVVRQITEAHGGAVIADNAAGGGARFRVRLPLGPPAREVVA